MSAVMVLFALVIDETQEPDFPAAMRAIDRLGPTGVEEAEIFDGLDPKMPQDMREIRAQLRDDLRELQEAIRNEVEIGELRLRKAKVYVSGGLSYGDAPTEICDALSRLYAVHGVLAAAGFEA